MVRGGGVLVPHIRNSPKAEDLTARGRRCATSRINLFVTTFLTSHCRYAVDTARSADHLGEEHTMSRTGEVGGDKLRAIVALIRRIDEAIGSRTSSKEERRYASKTSATAAKARSPQE